MSKVWYWHSNGVFISGEQSRESRNRLNEEKVAFSTNDWSNYISLREIKRTSNLNLAPNSKVDL